MDRHAVALVLQEIASLLQADGGNRFRARAFRTAAGAVDRLDVDLRAAVAGNTLREVPGIGPATARVIEELVVTGESGYLAALRDRSPGGLQQLLRVPGLGAKKIARLHAELGITELDELEAAARDGRIAALRGFGPRTQDTILAGIPFARSVAGRRMYHHAAAAAARLAGFIAGLPGAGGTHVAGALRRCHEVVDDIVIVAACAGDPHAFRAAVEAMPGLDWRIGAHGVVRARLGDGLAVAVHVTEPDAAGAALLFATGSDAHVQAVRAAAAAGGHELRRDGLFTDGRRTPTPDEDVVYDLLEMQHVPPELRETGAEVGRALAGTLPRLVEEADLRGCFHCHTSYSDGTASLREMAEGAIAMGWRYLGIADHSRSAGYAGGLTAERVRRQHAEIAAWNRTRGTELRIFAGVEADIMQDGQLDYAAQGEGDVLDAMDYVVGSVHGRFRMDRAAMTRRLQRAVSDPRLTFLGHATGRLLLLRDGYDVDLDAVIEAAAEHGAAIEINADPRRLDMAWPHWNRARELGVRAAVNPDAHSVEGMANVAFGINVARKAWLTTADVVNSWELAEVEAWFAGRRGHGAGS